MKHCCIDDPSDLCSLNISGLGFTDVKQEDLALFDNVAYVNAAENFLPFGVLKTLLYWTKTIHFHPLAKVMAYLIKCLFPG